MVTAIMGSDGIITSLSPAILRGGLDQVVAAKQRCTDQPSEWKRGETPVDPSREEMPMTIGQIHKGSSKLK